MTYRDLLYKAQRLINQNKITLDEYDKMTKPLDEEIRKTGKWLSTEECAIKFGIEVTEEIKNSFYKYCPFCDQVVFGKRNFCPNCGADMRGDNIRTNKKELE